jgi:PAS domain S-box-containing protein
VLTVLLFAAAFYILQHLTFAFRLPPYQRATIWIPGALVFAALLLAPPSRWWVYYAGLCLGAFAAFYDDGPIGLTGALVAAHGLFAALALGVWSYRRFATGSLFGSPASLVAFVGITVLAALGLNIPLELFRWVLGADNVSDVALRGALGDSLGYLLGTPALVLTVTNGPAYFRARSPTRIAEIVCLAVCLVAVGYLVFNRPTDRESIPALLYAPLPLLLWAATRFRLLGVSWALLVVAYQANWGAAQGHGPFTSQTPVENVLQLQCFLLASSLPLMFLSVVIEERGRAFAALAESEQEVRGQYAQLATIYQAAPVGLAFVDTQLRYVGVNDCMAEIHGVPAAAHVGRPVRDVLPHLADMVEPFYRRVLATGEPVVDVELRVPTLTGPGTERTWLVSRYPVKDARGVLLGVITVAQETTQRKQIEEARRELAHAARLAMVGELTASIAHEINQPLGAILSNADAAEMLLESSPAPLEEVRQILADIRKDDVRASEVIRRLRALLHKREMEAQPVDLNDTIQEVLRLVRGEAGRRVVAVEANLATDLPLVRGDKVHLQQVLLNLLLNGMEAMADAPGVRRITVRSSVDGNGLVEIAVSDTGPGIGADQLPRLFDPFFSTKKEGMGLGLSIARSLVEAHGGRIWAGDNPDRGVTFRFTLPTRAEQPARASPETPKATLEVNS